MSATQFLVHNEGDHVAVAVEDVEPGPARAVYMDSRRDVDLQVLERVPLGHKVALADLAEAAPIVEYKVRVALARVPIKRGQLVHVHNVRSAKWQPR